MLLAGDIGGTKTNLMTFSIHEGGLRPEIEATFRSVDYPSLEVIVREFIGQTGVPITKAVFGVAGPVVGGQSKITNLPWVIAEESLAAALNLAPARVRLLNDLEAIAYAVPHLAPGDLALLNEGRADIRPAGHKAVIAPGTGLGEAIIFYNNGQFHVLPSEGGHVDFAPMNLLQMELLRYLLGKFNHVSYERVCSGGLGIPNLHDFFKETRPAEESPVVAAALREAADPTPIIVQAALTGQCEVCRATLNTFISILGAEAGNLALKVMATGGIYLGGGIPPRILSRLQEGPFLAAFVNKGRFSELLARIPVYVILNDKAGLLGSAHCAWGI